MSAGWGFLYTSFVFRNHYKEYLVGLINKKKQDPVVIMNIDEMNTLLDRVECKLPRPKKAANESDEAFVKKYREVCTCLKWIHVIYQITQTHFS